jgi:outer membrane protein assembly factor BamB
VIFVPCGGGTVAVAVDAATMSFHRLWTASGASPNGPPVVAGGLVLATNWHTNEIVALQATSGTAVSTRATLALPHFATPGVGDGMVVVPTLSGVEAFRTEG